MVLALFPPLVVAFGERLLFDKLKPFGTRIYPNMRCARPNLLVGFDFLLQGHIKVQ